MINLQASENLLSNCQNEVVLKMYISLLCTYPPVPFFFNISTVTCIKFVTAASDNAY